MAKGNFKNDIGDIGKGLLGGARILARVVNAGAGQVVTQTDRLLGDKPPKPTCKRCEEVLPKGAKFCGGCGAEV